MTTQPSQPELDLDIDQLLALHRSVFGDARMEGGEESGSGGEGGSEGSGEGSTEGGTEGAGEGEGQSSEGGENTGKKPEDELPEWAREKLTKANNEAAKYRTSLRELEKKFEGAKTAEEYDTALSELQAKNAELAHEALVAKVARKFSLPDDLADVLKGDDEAALEAHAKTLQKYVGTEEDPEDLKGGLTPHDGKPATDEDPRELAAKYGGRRRPV